MNTIIIYDNTGTIIMQASGSMREPVGVPFIWVDVPQGQYAESIDVSGEVHVPVFVDLPKSETQLLQEQVADLNQAIAAIIGGAV